MEKISKYAKHYLSKSIDIVSLLKKCQLVNKQQVNDTRTKQRGFDFLDGYRGSLALTVLVIHSKLHHNCEIVNLFYGYSQSYAIAGFFMLSAFLLTYRLLVELSQMKYDPFQFLLSVIKFFIRRFFRIYLYYVLFYTVVKYAPDWWFGYPRSAFSTSITEICLLGKTGENHLWTIPAEIKYYFFIPCFCMTIRVLNKFQFILLIVCISWSAWDQVYNFFDLKTEDTGYQTSKSHFLTSHFAVFFLGSQVALAYYIVERNQSIMNIIELKWMQTLLDYSSLLIALVGLKLNMFVWYDTFAFKSRATIFWSISLFLTLLSRPNMISNFFSSSQFLKNFGRYSYSFYLFHYAISNMFRTSRFYTYQFEFILICIVVDYYASMLLYNLIESNLMHLANYLCNRLDSAWCFRRPLNMESDNNNKLIEIDIRTF